ncbi:MAG: S1 RNA-binding domain-containing protein, partial [Clostridia bacterium]
ISGGKEFLDNTSVHPESYAAAKELIDRCGYTDAERKSGAFGDIAKRAAVLNKAELCTELGIGAPTLNDIISALQKPGRDPRDELPQPLLRSGCMSLEDLKEGMVLDGTVRNVIDFGAFVDIGVHQDGLVHISQIANRYIKHPTEVLSVGDVVKVKVLSVDPKTKRISLSMKEV